ncbi:MAG: PrgI family protein [Candidatus Falkowbacteria bacterium]|nr:PrgI family protein [Candidatus Falkowbacteria bacterium]
MQQFTVPQFIDVEDKIIGPLTVRQFVIILVAMIISGISYKLFDFSLFVTVTVVMIILAALFSFVKINGRPFHLFMLNAFQTLRRPGLRIWNNRLLAVKTEEPNIGIKTAAPAALPKIYKRSRLAELALIVDTKGRYQGE